MRTLRRHLVSACALAIVACQPPWSVQGTVVAAATGAPAGGVVHKRIEDAVVTFRCPPGTLPPQTQGLSAQFAFGFSGKGSDFPLACELEVAAPGYVTFLESFTTLCERPSGATCQRAMVVIELTAVGAGPPAGAPTASAPPVAPSAPLPCPSAASPAPLHPAHPLRPQPKSGNFDHM